MKSNLALMLLPLLASSVLAIGGSAISNNCTVKLPNNGYLKGNCEHDTYNSFTNIPFGKPPVGKLRFEAPQPAEPWNGVRDALSEPIMCTQYYEGLPSIVGEEDCLYLNVYVPKAKPNGNNGPKKVILWIFPGAFTFGGPNNSPHLVMKEGEAIWINFAYRLGPTGFLSTSDERIPGNNGLKDQRLAIEWVYENIAAFGGDPKQITLFGGSAGGASVVFHLDTGNTRPAAFAAFSGTSSNRWAFNKKPEITARALGKYVNCSITAKDDIFKTCLQNVKIEDIWAATKQMHKFYGFNAAIFRPVIEPKNTPNAFLTEHPEKLISKSINKNKTFLVGTIKGEGHYGAANLMQRNATGDEVVDELNRDWYKACPTIFILEEESRSQQYLICSYLKKRYMCGKKFNIDSYSQLELMFGDEFFYIGIERSINLHRAAGFKVHMVMADLPKRYSLANVFSVNRNDLCFGSSHVNDVFGIFPIPMDVPESPPLPGEQETLREIIRMIESMSTNSPPTYNGTAIPVNINNSESTRTLYYTYGTHRVDKWRRERVNCQRVANLQCEA